jgi:hypothetical protein
MKKIFFKKNIRIFVKELNLVYLKAFLLTLGISGYISFLKNSKLG